MTCVIFAHPDSLSVWVLLDAHGVHVEYLSTAVTCPVRHRSSYSHTGEGTSPTSVFQPTVHVIALALIPVRVQGVALLADPRVHDLPPCARLAHYCPTPREGRGGSPRERDIRDREQPLPEDSDLAEGVPGEFLEIVGLVGGLPYHPTGHTPLISNLNVRKPLTGLDINRG